MGLAEANEELGCQVEPEGDKRHGLDSVCLYRWPKQSFEFDDQKQSRVRLCSSLNECILWYSGRR